MLQVCDRLNGEDIVIKPHSTHYQIRSIQQGTADTRPLNQSLKQDTFGPAVEPLTAKVAQS